VPDLKTSRIRFSGNSNISGPVKNNQAFVFVGSCDLSCIHVLVNYESVVETLVFRKTTYFLQAKLANFLNNRKMSDHQYHQNGKKKFVRTTKKLNCPYTIKIQEVLCFPGYENRNIKQ
ncbi:hypothetical protein KUTeg_007921, partial [Tegillarca granosa]